MHDKLRFAIVITHGGPGKGIIQTPWLETEYGIDESDRLILPDDGWRSVADGDLTNWGALERRGRVGFYVGRPQLVVVVGHPSDARDDDQVEERQEEVRRIVRRVRSLRLPAPVVGICTDHRGAPQDIWEPAEVGGRELAELQPLH
jgi:hypothetical protein